MRTRLLFQRLALVLWLIVLLLSAHAVAQKRGLQPTDYHKEVVVSEVAMAPAGSSWRSP